MKTSEIDRIHECHVYLRGLGDRSTLDDSEVAALCAAARRGSEDVVDPALRQLELVSREMHESLAAAGLAQTLPVTYSDLQRWQTMVDLARRGLSSEPPQPRACTATEHWSVPGLDSCRCGAMAITGRALAGRPIVYAAPAPGFERVKAGDIELVAVQLPANCSINVDVDLGRGDPPAAPFISVRARDGAAELLEIVREGF